MKARTALLMIGLGYYGLSRCSDTRPLEPSDLISDRRENLVQDNGPPLLSIGNDSTPIVSITAKFDPVRASENHAVRDTYCSFASHHSKALIYTISYFYIMREMFGSPAQQGLEGKEIDIKKLLGEQKTEKSILKNATYGDDSTAQIILSRKGLKELSDYNDSIQHARHLEPYAPLVILDASEDALDVTNGHVNAQAGNGKISVTLPMLKNYTVREIKSVIGHELAHQFYQDAGTMSRQSSPQTEHEADSIGIILTNDPRGGALSHKRELHLMQKRGENEKDVITHPLNIDRLKFYEKEFQRLNTRQIL